MVHYYTSTKGINVELVDHLSKDELDLITSWTPSVDRGNDAARFRDWLFNVKWAEPENFELAKLISTGMLQRGVNAKMGRLFLTQDRMAYRFVFEPGQTNNIANPDVRTRFDFEWDEAMKRIPGGLDGYRKRFGILSSVFFSEALKAYPDQSQRQLPALQLWNMLVALPKQSHGLGSAIQEAVDLKAKQLGVPCRFNCPRDAVRFYERFGYHIRHKCPIPEIGDFELLYCNSCNEAMTADRRRAELDAKRAKLADLKKAREERRTALSTASSRSETPSGRPSSRADLNDLISSLLSPPTPSTSRHASFLRNGAISPSQQDVGYSAQSSQIGDHQRQQTASVASDSERGNHSVEHASESGFEVEEDQAFVPYLTSQAQELYEVPAVKQRVTYDKSVQTMVATTSAVTLDDLDTENRANNVGRETETELRQRLLAEFEAERTRLDAAIQLERQTAIREEDESRRKGPSQESLQSIFSTTEFSGWLDHSSKVVERALNDRYDYLQDYSINPANDQIASADKRKVKCSHTFKDARLTQGRSTTAVDWSHRFQELMMASYSKSQSYADDPDGLVCVWNLHLTDRPEYVFEAQSDVLAALYSPFHANLIIGGTFAGQIVVWDNRAKSQPVLKSPLTAVGHTHPIYSLSLPGTQNAHNLVSASTDGTVCAWVLDMLAKPVETLELVHPGHSKADEVAITTLAFPDNESSTFWLGTEEGPIYEGHRFDRAGAKAGLVQNEIYRGHAGPVLGLHFHPNNGPVDFGDLFLSCGVDWTTRLWRANSHSKQPAPQVTASKSGSSHVNVPLATFEESDDYVMDVKWHPTHPAIFGRIDGAGKFDLWNLNLDAEVPIVSFEADPAQPRALNKFVWERRDGRRAAAGSTKGDVYIYDIGDLSTSRESEWDQMRKTIAQFASQNSNASRI